MFNGLSNTDPFDAYPFNTRSFNTDPFKGSPYSKRLIRYIYQMIVLLHYRASIKRAQPLSKRAQRQTLESELPSPWDQVQSRERPL